MLARWPNGTKRVSIPHCARIALQRVVAPEGDHDAGGREQLGFVRIAAAAPRSRARGGRERRMLVGERSEECRHERVVAVFDDDIALRAQREHGRHQRDADRRVARDDRDALDAARPCGGQTGPFDDTVERLQRAELGFDRAFQRRRTDPEEQPVERVLDDRRGVAEPALDLGGRANARRKVGIGPALRGVGDVRDDAPRRQRAQLVSHGAPPASRRRASSRAARRPARVPAITARPGRARRRYQRAEVLGLDRDHRAAVGQIDVPDRAHDAVGERPAVAVDDDRAQPRRCDLQPRLDPLASRRIVVVLRRELGHRVLGGDRSGREAQSGRRFAVERRAVDDAGASLEPARLHDARARRQREIGTALGQRVEQCDQRERGRRDADGDAIVARAANGTGECVDVELAGVHVPTARAVAAAPGDDVHHETQRAVRMLRGFGDEVEVAQPRSVAEQHAVERGEQRRFVQARCVELVAAGASVHRSARLEPHRGPCGGERREPRFFERRRRNRGDLRDAVGQTVRVETLRAREGRVRGIRVNLIREQRARQVKELLVAERVRTDRRENPRV